MQCRGLAFKGIRAFSMVLSGRFSDVLGSIRVSA